MTGITRVALVTGGASGMGAQTARRLATDGHWRAIRAASPLGRHQDRLGRPAEVAALIAFLLGDEASWITGTIVPIDGGTLATDPYRLVPRRTV